MLALAAPLAQAALASARASFPVAPSSTREAWQRRLITFYMHLQQPVARLIGRRKHGLTPWRRRGDAGAAPAVAPSQVWSETWHASETWIERTETALRSRGFIVTRGGHTDAWDLDVRGGVLGSLRARFALEEHGAGKQLVRLHTRLRSPAGALAATALGAALATGAALGGAMVATAALGLATAALALRVLADHAHARAGWGAAVQDINRQGAAAAAAAAAAPAARQAS